MTERRWTIRVCPECDQATDYLYHCPIGSKRPGVVERAATVEVEVCPVGSPAEGELEKVARAFVGWFDSRFPKGGKALPSGTLLSIAERARAALGKTDGGGEGEC